MKITKEALIAHLKEITASLEANDSFEGSLEYTSISDELADNEVNTHFIVKAFYRIGNSMGQGGCRVIQ